MAKLGGWGVSGLLLFLAGCGNREADMLAVGESVCFSDGSTQDVSAWVDRGGNDPVDRFEQVVIPAGTHGQVVEDEPARPPVQALLRLVRVKVADGPLQGREVELARNKLRPAK